MGTGGWYRCRISVGRRTTRVCVLERTYASWKMIRTAIDEYFTSISKYFCYYHILFHYFLPILRIPGNCVFFVIPVHKSTTRTSASEDITKFTNTYWEQDIPRRYRRRRERKVCWAQFRKFLLQEGEYRDYVDYFG